ncbi:MAG TPA: glycosyltransferase family 39 protein [Terriglobales bacterium]|nr:glycosyltransferase family 39 protein [Terriglobales bacterium]
MFQNSSLHTLNSYLQRDEVSSRAIDAILFLALAAALGFVLIFSPPVWQHGEAREGLVVESILQNHDWVLPLRNGELPSKPPLFHWIAAVFAMLLGFSDTIVRLPSLLAAMIMILATFCFAKATNGRGTAWLAVAVLLGTYEFWDSATEARLDMIFSAAVTVCLAAWFSWFRTRHFKPQLACYLAVACAVLSKGPAGLVLPAAVILGFLWLEGESGRIIDFWSWPLVALVIVLDLGWYGAALFVGGKPFVMKQIVSENIDRFAGTGIFSEHQRTLIPFAWLATRLFPWNIALLIALVRRLRGQKEDATGRFLHAWWSIIFVLFFLSAGQRAVYLLPLYPAVALLAGRILSRYIEGGHSVRIIPQTLHRLLPGVRSEASRNFLVVASAVALVGLCLAIATPVIRWSKMERSSQTDFVEKTKALVSEGASLKAAPTFPETTLIVLAYRLERQIPRTAPTCQESGYYLTKRSDLPPCLMAQRELASTGQSDKSLVLVETIDHPMNRSLEYRSGKAKLNSELKTRSSR